MFSLYPQTQTRSLSMIRHSTEHVWTAPETRALSLYSCLQLLFHENPFKEVPLHRFLADIDASENLEFFIHGITIAVVTFLHHVP